MKCSSRNGRSIPYLRRLRWCTRWSWPQRSCGARRCRCVDIVLLVFRPVGRFNSSPSPAQPTLSSFQINHLRCCLLNHRSAFHHHLDSLCSTYRLPSPSTEREERKRRKLKLKMKIVGIRRCARLPVFFPVRFPPSSPTFPFLSLPRVNQVGKS